MRDWGAGRPFALKASFDQAELVGARWWQESVLTESVAPTRRDALRKLLVGGAGVGGLGLIGSLLAMRGCGGDARSGRPGSDPDLASARARLEVQRRDGWNSGAADDPLAWPDAVTVDAEGAAFDPAKIPSLIAELRPGQPRLVPYYVPTLFQAIEGPTGESCRAQLRPIFSHALAAAFACGQAIGSQFDSAPAPADLALIVDLEGPASVAFAAGLAPKVDPVFCFDNWPHPKGVVPSHLVLGAVLYYLPILRKHRGPEERPPLMVLDRRRLAPYTDDGGQFDNRYLAKLPSVEAFRTLNVRQVLYVVPGGSAAQELDDLNDDFVRYQAGGIRVRVVSLGDFQRPPDAPALAVSPGSPGHSPAQYYYYGGYRHYHPWFGSHYLDSPNRPSPPSDPPPGVSNAYRYTPSPRRTMFSSGAQRGGWSGFSSSGGTGRSGSFGRSSGSSGGG